MRTHGIHTPGTRRRGDAGGRTLGVALTLLLAIAGCGPTVDTDAASAAPASASLGGPSAEQEADWRQPLFEGLGGIHFPVTTSSEKAQQYFDQGLSLAWAFNHAAADFAFNEAALHDPDCGMCLWGSALVLGPNVNAAMDPSSAPRARALAERADALVRADGTDKERALTAALLERYAVEAPEDRTRLDEAWADALRDVSARWPEDVHITALKAEALMDLHPWDFWLADGEERPWTTEIVDTIEHALDLDPDHAGAIHLYIHAVEQSREAGRAEPYADKLADIAPAAGHLVHMPAHIYMRVGRYYDSTINNMRAADADAAFVAACRSNSPIYLAGYVPHNWHFGWVTAAMAGWRAKAYEMAEGTAASLTEELLRAPGMEVAQHFYMQPTFAHLRFADWDAILATPAPAEDLPYARALWHFAQGMAKLGTGDAAGAAAEHATLEALRTDPAIMALPFFNRGDVANKVLAVAERMLAGRMAVAEGDLDAAVAIFSEGVAIEDSIPYSEPPDWYYPVRHELGRVQLAAGDATGAEATYRADLADMPENGWALVGLASALEAQGRSDAAAEVRARFDAAWAHADTPIEASTI